MVDIFLEIAFVCPRYYPYRGGVETYVMQVANRLCARHDVEVLTTDPSGKLPCAEEINGVSVRRFRAFDPNEAYYFSPNMAMYLKSNSCKYDIIHANDYHSLPAYYAAECKSTNKLVFTPHFHGTLGHTFLRSLLHIPYKFFGRRIFKKSDKIIYCSQFERQRLLRAFNIPENKLHRIREGITRFPSAHTHAHKIGFKHPLKIILCVARLEKYKGVQHIIQALPNLPDDFYLHVVGKGPYKQKLLKQTKNLGISTRIFWSQDLTMDELSEAYYCASVAVLFSEHEQYGYFIGEALASGLPCVVVKKDALSEWVDGVNCIGVSDPTDFEQVANALTTAISRKVSGISLPTWDEYVVSLQRLYDNVVS